MGCSLTFPGEVEASKGCQYKPSENRPIEEPLPEKIKANSKAELKYEKAINSV
jgi:hypothetical protein